MSRIIIKLEDFDQSGKYEIKEVFVCSYKVNVKNYSAYTNIKPEKVNIYASCTIDRWRELTSFYTRVTSCSSGRTLPVPEEPVRYLKMPFPDHVGIFTTMEECRRYYEYLVSQAMNELDKYYEEKKQRLLRTTKLPTKY